ncbi:unnamed protein product [Peniophora sp. CBMAI 1063]|nr:unnamed protein product [Peniophora sp. CBMAI 1063]
MDPLITNPISETTAVLDQCAHTACGLGSLSDLVTPSSLRTELSGFYREHAESPAAVSSLRLREALDVVFVLSAGTSGIAVSQLQTLCEYLVVEQTALITYTQSRDIDLIRRLMNDTQDISSTDRMRMLWDALISSQRESHSELEQDELGPLQWWLAVDALISGQTLRRHDIHCGVLRKSAERHGWASPSSPPVELAPAASRRSAMSSMAGDATVVARRTFVSPWLAPPGFNAEISWRITDHNKLLEELLTWPRGRPIPEALIWEHPAMHGCLVDTSGHAIQFQAGRTGI